jgi:hypothetical protein
MTPKLCPATPFRLIRIVSGLRPALTVFSRSRRTAPAVRFTLRTSRLNWTGSPVAIAFGKRRQIIVERAFQS